MWRVKNSCGSRQFIVINGYNDRLHQQSINSFSVGLRTIFSVCLVFHFYFYYFSAFDKSQSHMMGSSKDTTTKFSFSSIGYCKC